MRFSSASALRADTAAARELGPRARFLDYGFAPMMTILKLPLLHCILPPMAGREQAAVGTKEVPLGDGPH